MKNKYNIIAKTSIEEGDFKKWRCSDLMSLTKFLDKDYPDWKFFHVYDKATRKKLATFKQDHRPLSKFITNYQA